MPKQRSSRIATIIERPWALLPAALEQITGFLTSGEFAVGQTIPATPPAPQQAQSVIAVVPIYGAIERRSSWLQSIFGGTSVDLIQAALRQAVADPNVLGIVLDIDSPGGGVTGITELAAEIRAARSTKPIIAVADGMAASAAYWLGSQAEQFIVTPSGQVGSIGVYAMHEDDSGLLESEGIKITLISAGEHKVDGNPFEPLTDEAKAAIQKNVDAFYDQFVGDVAAGRGISAAKVKSDYGQGAVLLAKDALAAGMVDAIDTLDGAVRRLQRNARSQAASKAQAGETPTADNLELEPSSPLRGRVLMLEEDARLIAEHGKVRMSLRAKEGRPPFSDATIAALRSTRDAISELLPDEPPVANPAVDPPKPPAVQPPPAPAAEPPAPPRFKSSAEFRQFLEARS